MKTAFAALFGLVFLALGGFAGVSTIEAAYFGLASQKWPTVEGQVTRAAFEPRRRSKFRIHFEFAYSVNGRDHVGTRYSYFDRIFLSPQTAREMIRAHPTGAHVIVHYDASNPTRSVVQPGVNWSATALGGALALVFVTIGGGIAMFALRRD